MVADFDWDQGNREKCQRHGVTVAEIEDIFTREVLIIPDEAHSSHEKRFWAIGRTRAGRSVFVVYTLRGPSDRQILRPISARYMHRKEVVSYEEENPDLPE